MARGRALLAVAVAALLGGCGDGHDFTASEFVDRVNGEGVKMVVGERLPSGAGAKEVDAVTLPPLPGEPAPPPGSEGGAGGSGSLYVYGDSGGAADQLAACRHAAGPLCFQASNVVIVLSEDSSQIEVRRLAVAIQKLAQG